MYLICGLFVRSWHGTNVGAFGQYYLYNFNTINLHFKRNKFELTQRNTMNVRLSFREKRSRSVDYSFKTLKFDLLSEKLRPGTFFAVRIFEF